MSKIQEIESDGFLITPELSGALTALMQVTKMNMDPQIIADTCKSVLEKYEKQKPVYVYTSKRLDV
jgi:hypothetical protein